MGQGQAMTRPAELGKRKHRGYLEEAVFLDQALAEGQRIILTEVARLQRVGNSPNFADLVRRLSAQSERMAKLHAVHQQMRDLIERAPDEERSLQAQFDELQAKLDVLLSERMGRE